MSFKTWKYGQKSALAKLAGISKQRLDNILNGANCSRKLARKLATNSKTIGIYIPYEDWLQSDITNNQLFKNGA